SPRARRSIQRFPRDLFLSLPLSRSHVLPRLTFFQFSRSHVLPSLPVLHMTNRIKLTKPVVNSRADAERILGDIAASTAALNGAKAKLDQRLTAIRQDSEGTIDELKKRIE